MARASTHPIEPARESETGPKAATALDGLVGSRVRQRRMQAGLTLDQLAQALGITVPQVQKYETGKNRIGASRLHQIAGLLGAPISDFFAAQESTAAPAQDDRAQPDRSVFADRATIELAIAFNRIASPEVRRTLLDLARAAAAPQVSPDAEPVNGVRGRMALLQSAWPEHKPTPAPAAPGQAPRPAG